MTQIITPVILSGGSGTRLWPLSTPQHPKQFLPLTAQTSLFEQAMQRVDYPALFDEPLIVGSHIHAGLLQKLAAGCKIICEPSARNTAPAIALAALETDADSLLLVMPSDHVITDTEAFYEAVETGATAASDGWFVTLGISPEGPETGYGYIQLGAELRKSGQMFSVERFVEKPDRRAAQAMLDKGNYVWNAGIFLFRAGRLLAELEMHEPQMLSDVRQAHQAAKRSANLIWPDADAFARAKSQSIDYAVMERTERIACVSVSMGWSDVGSWDALMDFASRDAAGNALQGDVTAIACEGSLIRADMVKVRAYGLSDFIVIATPEAVLILPKGQSQRVKELIENDPTF